MGTPKSFGDSLVRDVGLKGPGRVWVKGQDALRERAQGFEHEIGAHETSASVEIKKSRSMLGILCTCLGYGTPCTDVKSIPFS